MNWKQKIAFVSAELETNESIEQDFFLNDSVISNNGVLKLKRYCPFVTDDYVEFLGLADGADIAQCTFFGSEESDMQDFVSGAKPYLNAYPKSTWFVFGHDAGGNPLLLHQTGRVALGNANATSDADATILAESFADFLGEVIMGRNYEALYKAAPENDPWLAFLIEQNWHD